MDKTHWLREALNEAGVDTSKVKFYVNKIKGSEHVLAKVDNRVLGIHAGDKVFLGVAR